MVSVYINIIYNINTYTTWIDIVILYGQAMKIEKNNVLMMQNE
jgi:hypothetical protein